MTALPPEQRPEREREAVARLAEEYRAKGYVVWVGGAVPSLPEELRGQQVDLVAKTEDGWILAEVKRRIDLQSDLRLKELAAKVAAVPHCKFELVVLESERDERPRPLEEAKELLSWADVVGAHHPGVAHVIRWSCFESVLLQLCHAQVIQVQPWTVERAIKVLYSDGQLDRAEYDMLMEAYRMRNAIVHRGGVAGPVRDLTNLGSLTLRLAASQGRSSAG
jgi:hypothetical protein